MIHSTAIIDADAKIESDVSIGAYSIIHAGVSIAKGTQIGSHVVINGPTTIGENNHIYPFSSIGEDPQDKKYEGESDSILIIGDGNVIREYCSINRGTHGGGGKTVLGNDNWIMAQVHIAHDCIIGNGVTVANNTGLAGHVTIDDHVVLGGFTGIRQFCHIGAYSFTVVASMVVKDVPPYLLVSGNTAKPCGLNREGLQRHGFTTDQLNTLKRAYKIVYREGNSLQEAVEKLQPMAETEERLVPFIEFIQASKLGIIR